MEKLYTKEALNKIAPGTGIPKAKHIAPKMQCPTQAYCIIRSSQLQAEHLFSAGCYFYTQNQKGWYIWHEERNTRSFRTDSDL